MNKRKKTAKGKGISQAEKLCCYTEGYGYADRGLADFGYFDECGHYHDPCCC